MRALVWLIGAVLNLIFLCVCVTLGGPVGFLGWCILTAACVLKVR